MLLLEYFIYLFTLLPFTWCISPQLRTDTGVVTVEGKALACFVCLFVLLGKRKNWVVRWLDYVCLCWVVAGEGGGGPLEM